MSKAILPAAAAVLLLPLAACGLFHFPDVSGIEYSPRTENQVLGSADPIRILFDFDVDRAAVEQVFSVLDFTGRVDGSYRWDGRAVTFIPEPDLIPGLRYVFSFKGVYRSADRVEYTANTVVPFFYISRETAGPCVMETSPRPGETVSAAAGLRLRFSCDIDPLSLGSGLSLTPAAEYTVTWNDGTRELILLPEKTWQNLCIYTLRCNEELRSVSGMPLLRECEVVFLVQEDTEPPVVVAVEAAINDPEREFPPIGADLDALLAYRDAIRITFSEPMAAEKTEQALSFSPTLPGTRYWIDESTLVFVPAGGYEPGTVYTLAIGRTAADRSGNVLEGFEPLTFTARIDPLSVSTELVSDGIVLAPGEYSACTAREISVGPVPPHTYTLIFQIGGGVFDRDSEKLGAQKAITLSCLFPPDTPSPAVTGYTWTGDTRLDITFSGFEPSSANYRRYYLLKIRGGASGLQTEEGNRLEHDIEQLLVTGEP